MVDKDLKVLSFVLVTHLIQFYLKLEEKVHAKEAEMNKIQAKTQVYVVIDSQFYSFSFWVGELMYKFYQQLNYQFEMYN